MPSRRKSRAQILRTREKRRLADYAVEQRYLQMIRNENVWRGQQPPSWHRMPTKYMLRLRAAYIAQGSEQEINRVLRMSQPMRSRAGVMHLDRLRHYIIMTKSPGQPIPHFGYVFSANALMLRETWRDKRLLCLAILRVLRDEEPG